MTLPAPPPRASLRVDWQTLQDLGILNPAGSQASIFDWANFTRTQGGLQRLRERFQHSLADPVYEIDLLCSLALRHPLLERAVANDLTVTPTERLHFITGANMAGKSTYLKAAATILRSQTSRETMTADRQPLSPVTERPFPEGAFDAPVLVAVAGLLASVWDPGGALLEAASQHADPSQPDAPQSYAGYAQIVCGMLAAGGNLAQISQYLRLEEERLLGVAQSSGKDRWSIAWGAAGLMGKPFPQHPA